MWQAKSAEPTYFEICVESAPKGLSDTKFGQLNAHLRSRTCSLVKADRAGKIDFAFLSPSSPREFELHAPSGSRTIYLYVKSAPNWPMPILNPLEFEAQLYLRFSSSRPSKHWSSMLMIPGALRTAKLFSHDMLEADHPCGTWSGAVCPFTCTSTRRTL